MLKIYVNIIHMKIKLKIKRSFLKIAVSFLAVFSFLAAFFPKSFWGEPVNLKKIESGSKKVFKNIEKNLEVRSAEAHDCGGGYGGGDMQEDGSSGSGDSGACADGCGACCGGCF